MRSFLNAQKRLEEKLSNNPAIHSQEIRLKNTILFTIANAPGTVYKFRSFKNQGYRVIACDANPDAAGRHFADAFYPVPFQREPDYVSRLMEIIKKEKVEILVAAEGESLMLIDQKEQFDSLNCTLVATDPHTLNIALDKITLFNFLKENAPIPLPGFYEVNNLQEFDNGVKALSPSQLCIKPARTSGSRGFVILKDGLPDAKDIFIRKSGFQELTLDQFRQILMKSTEIPKLILMDFMQETNYDSNMVCKEGKILFQSVKTREEAKVGTITKGKIVKNDEIVEINHQIAQVLKTTGLISTQFIGNKLIEINPRWSTSLDYKSINEYLMGVKIFTGEEIKINSLDVEEYTGLKMVRYWDVITYK